MLISMFLEISTSLVALAGFISFFRLFRQKRQLIHLYVCLLFAVVFIDNVSVFSAQILFNLGQTFLDVFLYKAILMGMVLTIFLAWFYLLELFRIRSRFLTGLSLIVCLTAALESYFIIRTPLHLIYRQGLITPLFDWSLVLPLSLFGAAVFLLASFFAFGRARQVYQQKKSLGQEKRLNILGLSALAVIGMFVSTLLQIITGWALFYALSWLFVLLASCGLYLGNIIPDQGPLATRPWQYPQTRILFKLIGIFVLLVIFSIQITSLILINQGKAALSQEIDRRYQQQAAKLVDTVNRLSGAGGRLDSPAIRQLLAREKVGKSGLVCLVHRPDKKTIPADLSAATFLPDPSDHKAWDEIFSSSTGQLEFTSRSGQLLTASARPLEQPDWFLVIAEPAFDAYYQIRLMEASFVLITLAVIMVTVIIGSLAAQAVEKPLRRLTELTTEVQQGHLDQAVEVGSLDEIGQLAANFNLMTHNLKIARDKIENWNRQLESEVASRTKELTQSNADLRRAYQDLEQAQAQLLQAAKMSTMGELVSGLAHEINNPLTSIIMFVELLKKNCPDTDPRVGEYLTNLKQLTDHLRITAHNFLSFASKTDPVLEPVDLVEIIDLAAKMVRYPLMKKNIEMIFQPGADLPRVIGDKGQLQQVFLNLFTNAVHALTEGGRLLVTVHRRPASRAVEVKVHDNGCGIPPEHLDKIFRPFFTTRKLEEGTGLGLSICKGIIDRHHGQIEVESQVGQGTTFIVSLPAVS